LAFETFTRNAESGRREGEHHLAAVGLVLSVVGDHGLLHEILILSDGSQRRPYAGNALASVAMPIAI
jgi:hypothetical protein